MDSSTPEQLSPRSSESVRNITESGSAMLTDRAKATFVDADLQSDQMRKCSTPTFSSREKPSENDTSTREAARVRNASRDGKPAKTVVTAGKPPGKSQKVPLILNMSQSPANLSLLPAGLPPGRYIILPSATSMPAAVTTVAKPTVSTLTSSNTITKTTPSHGAPAAFHRPGRSQLGNRVQVMRGRPKCFSDRGAVSAGGVRGTRRSYTAAEKLAMISAVESGQRKSSVADRFGVASSTLACILLQKNKIRSDQDLTRRRLRQTKVHKALTPTMPQRNDNSVGAPFLHFLSSLSPSLASSVSNEIPEEIVSVPDLAETLQAPYLSMLLEKSKLTPQKSSVDSTPVQQASCSDYTIEMDTAGATDSTNNDAEEELSVNHSEEEINVNESLNGPYLLKKETHCSTILDQLLRDDTYTDVTLTAEGQSIRAHKVVLSLSSGYFREVLDKDVNARNVVFFRDLKFDHLKNIINFIYTGEATINADELESFMNTAQMLEISSLADGYKNLPKVVFKKPTKSAKRFAQSASSSSRKAQKVRGGSFASSNNRDDEMGVDVLPHIKSEPKDEPADDSDNQCHTNDTEDTESKPDIADFLHTEHYQSDDNQNLTTDSIEDGDIELSGPPPGKCPYCSYKEEKKKLAQIVKHLLFNHACKPAFHCDLCYRVYVKENKFNSHKKNCSSIS